MRRWVTLVASASASALPSLRPTTDADAGTLPERSRTVASGSAGDPSSGTATMLTSCARATLTSSVGPVGFQLGTSGSTKDARESPADGLAEAAPATVDCPDERGVGDRKGADASGDEHAENASAAIATRATANRRMPRRASPATA
jgi:hypothetical protein